MLTKTFRAKPIECEAILCRDALWAAGHSWRQLPPWLQKLYDDGKILFAADEAWVKRDCDTGMDTEVPPDHYIIYESGDISIVPKETLERTHDLVPPVGRVVKLADASGEPNAE